MTAQGRTATRGAGAALLLGLLAQIAPSPAAAQQGGYPLPPQLLFKDLFTAVQSAAIYPDGKAFADAVPDGAPGEILAQYHATHPASAQALKRFTDAHFTLPMQASPRRCRASRLARRSGRPGQRARPGGRRASVHRP